MRRRIFVVLFLAIFVAMVGMGIISPLMGDFAKDLGASGIWIGVIFGAFSFSRLVFMPLMGRISDRQGRKRFIAGGLLIYSLFSLAYTLPWLDYHTLAAVRFLHGIGSAMVIPIAMAYMGEVSEQEKEGFSMGIFHQALFMGLAGGTFLGAFMAPSFGRESAFFALAGLAAAAFLIVILFLPPTAREHEFSKQETITNREAIKDNPIKGLLFFRAANALGFGGLLGFTAIFIEESELTSVLVDRWSMAESSAWPDKAIEMTGILLTVHIFLIGVLQIPFGKLADNYNKYVLSLLGSIIASVGLLLMALAQNFEQLLLIAAVIAIGSALSIPAASAILVKKVGKKTGMGAQVGLFNTAMSLGIISGSLIFGATYQGLGVGYLFLVGGILSVCANLPFYLLIRKEMGIGQIRPL